MSRNQQPQSTDDLLVEALAHGAKQRQAGELAGGISKRTVARRTDDPEFRQRVSRRRGEVLSELTGKFTSLTEDALDAIRDVLANGRPADRLNAARLVVTSIVSLRRDGELEERLREIEDSIDGNAGHGADA